MTEADGRASGSVEQRVEHPEDVRRALKQAGVEAGGERPRMSATHKMRLGAYVVAFLALALLLYAAGLGFLSFLGTYTTAFQRLVRGGMILVAVLGISRLVQIQAIDRLESPVARYNLERVLRLV